MSHQPSRQLSPLALILASALILVYLLQILMAVQQQSQTNDEGYHLLAGYRYWQCGDFGINPEHPPLVKFVATAPVVFAHIKAPGGECGRESSDKYQGYDRSFRWFYSEGNNPDRMMLLGRSAASLFSVALAIVCFLFANELLGVVAALLSLTLLVFEPTLIAHGALVTTDTAVTALMLTSVYAFFRYAQQRTQSRLILTGIVTGLTLASKHSGALILPILLVLAATEAWRTCREATTRKSPGRVWFSYLGAFLVILLIAVGVLWTVYGWRYAARPHGVAMTDPLPNFIADVEEQGTRTIVVTHIIPLVARLHLLPEAYLYGFVDVLNISDPGQPPFLLGRLYPHGQWFYFPITFIIKSTIGFLGLLALAIFAVTWRKLGLRRQMIYVLAPIAVVITVAMRSGLNIGYRHILPIVPFLCLLLGAAAAWLLTRSRRWQVAVVLLFAAHIVSSLRAFPNYIPYSNEAFGGPNRTYRVLTDANADWGQGMKQVAAYLRQKGITDCWFAYDGVSSRKYYGVRCKELPPNQWGAEAAVPRHIEGIVLVSALTASGIEWENDALNPYREFLQREPDAVIDGSVLVFHGSFDLPGVAAVQHIANANRLMDEKQFERADSEAQQAVKLTPQSVRAHIALGRALAAVNQPEQGRCALETALQLAHAQPEWYPNELAVAGWELQKLSH